MYCVKELSFDVAERMDITKRDAEAVTRMVFEVIADKMLENEDVEIPGFCKFSVVTSKATTGRNPRTGEHVDVPERKLPHCKFSASLRNRVKAAGAAEIAEAAGTAKTA